MKTIRKRTNSILTLIVRQLLVLMLFMLIPAINTQATTETSASTEAATEASTEAVSPEAPAKPKVTGTYSKKKVKLSWKKVKNATIYYIYKENADGNYDLIGETSSTKYSDKSVEQNSSYNYKVVAAYFADTQQITGKPSAVCTVFTTVIDPSKKMVAITYDDGPGPYTKSIVKCLKENDAKATFFVVGQNVSSYKSALKAADKIGCEIGNHSWNHSNLASLSASQIKSQMNKTDKQVKKAIGKKTTLMRTPYGSSGGAVKKSVGKPIILWSIDTLDWKTRNRDKTVSAVMKNVKDGDIILMHDIHKPTMQASLILIPKLKAKGYQLVTVSELAQYRNHKLKKGKTYSNLRKKKK